MKMVAAGDRLLLKKGNVAEPADKEIDYKNVFSLALGPHFYRFLNFPQAFNNIPLWISTGRLDILVPRPSGPTRCQGKRPVVHSRSSDVSIAEISFSRSHRKVKKSS
jgi:hypothetical protein